MPLKNAGSQIAFTSVASNMYAAIIVGHVEAGLVQKHCISPLSTPVTAFTCPLQSLDNGSRRNVMRATSPALKIRRRTVEADRSKPVAVFQRRLNTVDGAVRSVTTMWTRWRSSRAVVTLRGPVPASLCVRPSSLHWLHTPIIVVAACPVRAVMSRYDKPASRRPTILPRSNAHLLILCPFVSTRHICTTFHVWTLFGSSALTEQGITLTLLVTQEISLLGLCLRHLLEM